MNGPQKGDAKPLNALVIRKEPKDHGRGKQVEGPFQDGDVVGDEPSQNGRLP